MSATALDNPSSKRTDSARATTGTVTLARCPLCDGASSKLLFEAKDWVFQVSDDTFGVRRCLSCSAGYVSPRPRPSELAHYYPPEYYWSHEGGNTPLSWDEVVARRGPQLDAKARTLAKYRPGRLLDIGAQKGEFIWYMQRLGWQVEGVELDNSVPNPQRLPIRQGDFLLMPFDFGSYDVITAWAVLEHVDQPRLFIEQAARLLRPGGRFVAVVTNLDSVQARWFRADDFPRHLTLFTERSVRKLAESYGLVMRRAWTDQRIFGGALNGGAILMLKRLGGYTEEEAFAEWKQVGDPLLFFGKWRGNPSAAVLNVSRLDRALTVLPERILDALGFGFNMTFVLEKPQLSESQSRSAVNGARGSSA